MAQPYRNPNSLYQPRTLNEISRGNYSPTDYDFVEGLKATSLAAVQRNFTMTAADWLKQYDERRDMKMGKYAPVTREEYEESPAQRYGLAFRANENPYTFQRRVQRAASLAHYNEVSQGQDRQISQFFTSLGTGLVSDPVNFVGLGMGASVAKGTLYAAAGKRSAAAYHTGKGTFKNVLAYGAAFEVPYAYMTNDLGVEQYTFEHAKMAAGMNTLFAGILAGGSAGMAARSAGKAAKAKNDYNTYTRLMEGDSSIFDAYANVYENGSRGVVNAIKKNQRLKDIAEGRIKQDDISMNDMLEMAAFLKMHEINTKTSSMASALAEKYIAKIQQGDVSILKTVKEYEAQIKRVSEASLFGKVKRLTDEDVAVLLENGFTDIRKTGDDIKASLGGNQLHKGYTITENYGTVTKAEAEANLIVFEDARNIYIDERRYNDVIDDISLMEGDLQRIDSLLDSDIITADKQRANLVERRKKIVEKLESHKNTASTLRKQIYKNKQDFNKIIGETYAQTVQDVNGIVNGVLFGDEKAIPARIAPQPSNLNAEGVAMGWKVPGELVNYVAQPHLFFADAYVKQSEIRADRVPTSEIVTTQLLSTVFHEGWHNIQEINPMAYAKLLAIAQRSGTKKALEAALVARGYGKSKEIFEEEAGSHLMEFAISRPEFWAALKESEPKLFSKYKMFVLNLLGYAADILKISGLESIKDIKKPAIVAEHVAAVVRELRESTNPALQLKTLYNGGTSIKSKSSVKAKAAYENPNFKSRAEEMRKYTADPKKYLEDTILEVVGDESVIPTLMPGILPTTAKELNTYVAEGIAALDKIGMGHLTPYIKDILINQMGTEKRRKAILKVIRNGVPSPELVIATLRNLKEVKAPLEMAQRISFILLDKDLSPAEKLGKVNDFFYQENLAMVLRSVHNASVAESLMGVLRGKRTSASKMRQLKTILDGSLRKATDRTTSIQRLVDGQIIKDQAPLVEFLVNNDLLEVFLGEDPTKYMSSYRDATIKDPEVARVYGENLKEGSMQLHLDLMDAISSGEVPKRLEGLKVFEELVDIIQTINLGQMAEINHLGVNMGQRKNYSGYTPKYDRQVVSAMSEAEFINFMLKVLDVEQTERLHGGLMEGAIDPKINRATTESLGADGKPKQQSLTFDRFEINEFLRRFYNEIVSGKFDDEDASGAKSIVGSMRKAAKLAYKQEHRNEAMVTLSNFDNLGRLMLEQIRNRSEKIALVKNLGHDPYSMVMGVANRSGLKNEKGYSILDATAKQVTGMLDNPVDVNLAQNFQKLRQVSNVLFLAGSGMSALSDIPLMLTTMQYLGTEVTFKDFIASYRQAANSHFRGNNKEIAAWFRSQGAGIDIITRQTAQRVVTGESIEGGLIAKANQVMFELNGLNRITATHQMVFLDIITNSLGEQFRSGKLNPVLEARMREFGFVDKELKALSKFVEKTPDGKYRLGSSGVSNAPLQRKLSGFLTTYMKEAVIEPDAGAMAITRLGLESGTITGETARVALQYSSFMLGMSRVVYRRFLYGYNGDAKHNAMKMSHLITYVGAALAFAYMTTILKDLSKFKEPIDPTDMTFFDLTRILRQSGIMGIGELGLNAAQFGPASTLSPIAGSAVDVLSGDVAKGLKPLTGQQYPVIGKAISFVMAETLQNMQNDVISFQNMQNSVSNSNQNKSD